ncbi:MAG TPA: CocE/NonD family hydrolase, partial [Solirubrobacterales bacterium]|nr:CocE/NonD family hydrolase [Solirubrobacterales bacterium]
MTKRPGRRMVGSSVLGLALLLLFLIPTGAGAAGAAPAFEAHGSVEQVYATGIAPGARATLYDSNGKMVQSKDADELGGVLFREVAPGGGYRLQVGPGRHSESSGPLTVLTQRSAPPDPSIYEQKIAPHGYQYLSTRDGTQLAIDVHPPQDVAKVLTGLVPNPGEGSGGTPELPELPQLPLGELEEKLKEIPGVGKEMEGLSELLGPVTEKLAGAGSGGPTASASSAELPYVPTGPTPTLIEYSGYGYANPAGPENGIALIANLLGFTVVDVNMRGTGCSGGAYDFFEPLQNLDGYDVVETIAHQPWVLHHEVGMMGISYGGISQLFTAA